jgi:hypothetical protein
MRRLAAAIDDVLTVIAVTIVFAIVAVLEALGRRR